MIKAEHKKWAKIVFDFYINQLLKSNFNSFLLINEIPDIPEDKSFIVTPNHFSWWDGFFIDYLFKKITNKKLFIMMLEDQLKKYRFFSKVGAYSINQKNPKSIVESFDYTRKILEDKQNFVVLYPQGEIEHFDKKEIVLKSGLNYLLRNIENNLSIFPICFNIRFGNEKKPDILVKFGNVINSTDIKNDFTAYKIQFQNLIDEVKEYQIKGNEINFFEK